jgi:deoxyribonuclease-4
MLGSSLRSVVSHASYLLNLAGDDHTRNRSKQALAEEIERCDQLGIDAVVLHPGSSKGIERGRALERLADALRDVLSATEETRVTVLLETMAGQGDILGTGVEELADVIEMLGWDDRLGVCVDICHLFGAGLDLRTEGGYERLVASLKKQVGYARVGCWHMSDNKGKLGSRVDRHAHIGEGEIGFIPFGMLVSDERFSNTPTVLETPKEGIGDEGNLALLRKLRGFETQGSD